MWASRYFEVWQITLSHVIDLLTIHGPVRDPYLSEFSERYDLDSGCSVESTLLLHLVVVLVADTRPATVLPLWCTHVFTHAHTTPDHV